MIFNIKFEISDKKNIFVNGVKIKKLSELLGIIHIVIFVHDDEFLSWLQNDLHYIPIVN